MLDHRAMSRASEVRQQLKRYVTRLEKRNSNSASAASDGNRIVKDEPTTSSFQRYGGNELQGEPLRKAFVAVSRKYSYSFSFSKCGVIFLCVYTPPPSLGLLLACCTTLL